MDLLGSIMKKMEKPPGLDEKQKLRLKQQREMMQKQREEQQRRAVKFKDTMQQKIDDFAKDETQERLVLEPMDKPLRAIIHGMAETAMLVALSFGIEEVDRHVILFKHDTAPCEDEIIAMRRGEAYDPDAKVRENREEDNEESAEQEQPRPKKRGRQNEPKPEYLNKYEKHFGGLDVAKDAAKSTDTTRSYGFVSSEQKKDKRTIEETLADIRAKKQQKLNNEQGD